jgi:6-phosphogluconolactonase
MKTNEPPFTSVPRGSGPRHVAFHPTGRWAYSINELNNTISAFSFESKTGTLKSTQNITTIPDEYRGESYAAEIQVHPTGRYLYASNRGHDSLARYAVDPQTGQLRRSGHTLTGGKFPRHFTIDPAGQFLIVANQKSDQLVLFQIDPQTGDLQPSGKPITITQPVCVKLLTQPQ